MGDIGELFNELKKENKIKKWEIHDEVLKKLAKVNIEVFPLGDGSGTYRPCGYGNITIYATKAAWYDAQARKRHYDIESLIKFIKEKNNEFKK